MGVRRSGRSPDSPAPCGHTEGMVDQPPTRIHPFVYRGDNYGGIMTPLFAVLFGAASVFVLYRSLRGDGPPLWFALLWVALVITLVGTSTFLFATKIVVSPTLISWNYLGRRGGTALVEDIESVGRLGWAMPGWVRLKDGRRIWIQTTPGFKAFRKAIQLFSPGARV